MTDSSRFPFDAQVVDDFSPIVHPTLFREHLEWYLDGCTPYSSSPRIEEVSDCLVGKADTTKSIDAVARAIKIKNMDSQYREIAERGLKMLVTIEFHTTQTHEYVEAFPPSKDKLWFRELQITEKTAFLIYEKTLFTDLLETSVYDFSSPRNLTKAKEQLTEGFKKV